jgi:hypothetical protein
VNASENAGIESRMTDFELDPIIDQIAREARRPVAVDRDAKARVLEAVRAEPMPVRSPGSWRSLFAPRTVVVTPWRIAALAAGLVGVGVLLGFGSRFGRDRHEIGQQEVADVSSPHLPASDTVFTFVVIAPTAAKVSVVGDFNQWNAGANPMTRIENSNAWRVTVPMLAGRHLYSFFTVGRDGEQWLADPSAPAAPDDGFGRANSVIIVGKGSTL